MTLRKMKLFIPMLALAAACAGMPQTDGGRYADLDGSDWPALTSPMPLDPAMEARIGQIVAGMTLAQKVGQMTQPDVRNITPDQVREFYIGSVLNGGGAWPNMEKDASVAEWAATATWSPPPSTIWATAAPSRASTRARTAPPAPR